MVEEQKKHESVLVKKKVLINTQTEELPDESEVAKIESMWEKMYASLVDEGKQLMIFGGQTTAKREEEYLLYHY